MSTDFYTHAIADNMRFARSRLLSSPADDTYNLIRLPKFSFVTDIWFNVITPANVAPETCSVGFVGNGETAVVDGFMNLDTTEPTKVGMKRAMEVSLVTFPGKYFSGGSGVVTFTFAAGSATTKGIYRVFCQYTVIH